MQTLDKNKIDGLLKSLGNAGKNAVAGLNAMTDGEFKGSPLESDPLNHLTQIVRTLQNARDKADANARFEGMDAEQISALQEQERIEEQETIQAKFNERLAKRQPEPEQPEDTGTDEPSGGGDGDPDPNQQQDPPQS